MSIKEFPFSNVTFVKVSIFIDFWAIGHSPTHNFVHLNLFSQLRFNFLNVVEVLGPYLIN